MPAAAATFPDGGNGSTGGIIDSQSAVGGWPELTATDEEKRRAATDSDNDGIPDYYETLLGLDPNDASDADATTLDPQGIYPNIEVYFHFLVREISAAPDRRRQLYRLGMKPPESQPEMRTMLFC